MKKVHVFQLVLISAIVLVVGCASPSKMLKNAALLKYEVSPDPLEMRGDSVEVTVSGSFPAKYFTKTATMVVTPILKWEGGSVSFDQVSLQGEKVQGNAAVISNVAGGSFTYKGKVPYQAAMMQSELVVSSSVSVKSKTVTLPEVKIADGVIATASLLNNKALTIEAVNQLQRVELVSSESQILFPISQSVVMSKELNSSMKTLKAFTTQLKKDTTLTFKNIEVVAYASPDGTEETNATLAQSRQAAAEKAVKKELKKDKFVGNSVAEDWEGFKKLMIESNIQDKEVILSVLEQYSDPVAREAEIKKMAVVYDQIALDILPKLRRSRIIVNAERLGKSDSILLAKSLTIDSKVMLTEEEFLFTSTIAKSLDDEIKILTNGATVHVNSWKLYNNLGCAYLEQDKVAEAQSSFKRADELSEGDKAVKNNLGVVAVKQGDLAKGVEFFEVAQGAGAEVRYNMGLLEVKKGDYSKAVTMFGDNTTFNSSLAKLLNGDVDGSLQTLTKASEGETAVAYYLKAIIGARQKNVDMVVLNLKIAIEKDASLLERAKKDLEFKAYAEDTNFKSVVR